MTTAIVNQEREPLRALIDWVQVTFPFSNLERVLDILGIPKEEFAESPGSMYFYSKQLRCGGIWVLYEGYAPNTANTIHVQFSGQGCREYENYYPYEWRNLFDRMVEANGRFTRLDVAIDEIRYDGEKPYFTMNRLIRKVKRDECRSKFKKAKRIETIKIDGGLSSGQTIYFGSDKSDIQVVAYEKNHERENADKELEANLTLWNRMEIRMRDDRAQECVMILLMGLDVGSLILGVLKNYVDIVDRQKGDSNKARWPRSLWWEEYTMSVSKIKLAKVAPDKTIEQNASWIDKQVLPSLAMQFIAHGYSQDWIVDMIEKGMERMNDAQLQKAEEYLEYQKQATEERMEKGRQRLDEYMKKVIKIREKRKKELG